MLDVPTHYGRLLSYLLPQPFFQQPVFTIAKVDYAAIWFAILGGKGASADLFVKLIRWSKTISTAPSFATQLTR
jgi:hypothetical protein